VNAGDTLFLALAEASSDGVLLVDDAGCVRYASPRAAALLDRLREHIVGRPLSETGLRAQPGTQYIGEWVLNVQVAPAPGGQVLTVRSAEGDSAEGQRQHLIERIQHMLRNQLAAVSGFLDLVDMPALSPADADLVARAQATADRLNDALPRLLDIAWLESGVPIVREPLDLADVLREVVEALRAEAAARQIAVHVDMPAGLPLVCGSAVRLREALSEVVRNALAYSGPGGQVWVRLRAEGGSLVCAVQDEGVGISEDDQGMVFDRLFRSRDPRVRAVPGHGLGLTLARRIARAHEASLSLSSTPDNGSTFTLTIPHL